MSAATVLARLWQAALRHDQDPGRHRAPAGRHRPLTDRPTELIPAVRKDVTR